MNRIYEKMGSVFFTLCATASIVSVACICIFLFGGGVGAIFEIGPLEFLLGTVWKPSNNQFGILPMITGSIFVTIGAILIGVPIGILSAAFMAKFCPKYLYAYLKPLIELMSGIPSIVYGFFGMVVIVPIIGEHFTGNGYSIMAASLLLGIMILPTVIGVSEAAIRAVPESYYEGAVALGASHERAVLFTVVPAAKSGIMASVVLGVGRAIGETMAVIMVAGNQARMPNGIFKGIRTMTANVVLEMAYAADLHREALIATGVVLFCFILVINLIFAKLKKSIT